MTAQFPIDEAASPSRLPTVSHVEQMASAGVSSSRLEAAPAAVRRSEASRRYRWIALWLAVTDIVCMNASLLVASLIGSGWNHEPQTNLPATIGASLTWVITFHAFGLYSPQNLSPVEIFRRTIAAASVGRVLLLLVGFWSKPSPPRGWIALTFVLALVFELGARRVWSHHLGRLRSRGVLSLRTAVVGANDEAGRIAQTLEARGSGYTPIGFIGLHEAESPGELPMLGDLEELERVVRQGEVDCLFVASTALSNAEMMRVTHAARHSGVEVRVSANLPEILTSRVTLQTVGTTMTLSLKPVRLTGTQAIVKRAFDLVAAGLLFVLTLPMLAAIAIGIRINSPGPILFRQERVTKGGRPFTVLKFRTMVDGADRVEDDDVDRSVAFFKMRDDPRITSFGRVLRRLSLDELPQLWNVLMGDMSLVGPRPLAREQVEANADQMLDRHEVLAGVTGWWQVNGRSDVTAQEALNFDIFYIENWSLALDLYILIKTFGVIVRQKGAY